MPVSPNQLRGLLWCLISALASPCLSKADRPPLFKVAVESQLGFVSSDGAIVAPPQFAGCSRRWSEGFLWIVATRTNDFSGNFMNAAGRLLLSSPAGRYADDVLHAPPIFSDGRAVVETASGQYAVVTREGLAAPSEYLYGSPPVRSDCDSVTAGEFGFWIAEKSGRMGILAPDGSWVREPAFHEIRRWGPGAVSVRHNDKWGLLGTADGQMIDPPKWDEIEFLSQGAAWFRRDGKWGMNTYSGETLHPFEFDSVLWVSPENGLWKVEREGQWGLVNAKGETLLPCAYRSIDRMSTPYLAVGAESGMGLFDSNARQMVVPPSFDQVVCWPELSNASAAVLSGNKWGLVRLGDEHLLLPIEHDSLRPWHGLVEARKDNRVALFDPKGFAILPWSAETTQIPDSLSGMPNGLGKVVCDGFSGLIDSNGIVRLPCRFQDVGIFSEGAVPARLGGKWGYVNLDGEWLIPPHYDLARAFSEGLAAVLQNGSYGVIDQSGRLVLPFQFPDVGYAFNGLFPAARDVNGRLQWGLVRPDGTRAIPLEYDALEWIDFSPEGTRIHGRMSWEEY